MLYTGDDEDACFCHCASVCLYVRLSVCVWPIREYMAQLGRVPEWFECLVCSLTLCTLPVISQSLYKETPALATRLTVNPHKDLLAGAGTPRGRGALR